MRIIILLLIICAGAAAIEPAAELRATFTYLGVAVNPALVELFSNRMSDPIDPQVLAVDLSTAQGSNRFAADGAARDAAGWVTATRADPGDRTTFGYRFVGSLPSGTMVLHTYESGGGSGTFESVMLLAASAAQATASDGSRRTRQVLAVLRTVPLGDRANATLDLAGTSVRVDRAQAHDEAQRTALVIADPQLHEGPLPRR